ncbi:DUF481 domain-containing protein [Gilvimarinus algae]|uniref:DUF481 domain-containing protein n=1 Tax=Gilvimarinus algae TaxID=3058037 RepID=A0ABT8TFU6_9GAMM|nr:DUF481 domain-containing protein [Gilvimarinus sp. SDUM040014]MDO3382923.1 DUF481 domain-containing protein [Gilvimarinus sp. SDUM040014]
MNPLTRGWGAVLLAVTAALPSAGLLASDSATTATIAIDAPWDWVKLTSGEWLKGELTALEKDSLSFDSDELGEQAIDWSSVAAIHTTAPVNVLTNNQQLYLGKLETVDGKLFIGEAGPMALSDVLHIARTSRRERERWSGKIGAGINYRTGNVDQKDFNANLNLLRRTARSSVRLTYLADVFYDGGEETSNEHRATGSYYVRRSERWFWQPVQFEYYSAPLQNISSQWTAGLGGGIYLFDTSDLSWTLSAGPGYMYTRYEETPSGEERTVDSGAFFLSSQYDQTLTRYMDLSASYQLTATNRESGQYKHHGVISLSIDLTDKLDLTTSAYWDRIKYPQPDAEGVTPERDDFRYTVGVSYEF